MLRYGLVAKFTVKLLVLEATLRSCCVLDPENLAFILRLHVSQLSPKSSDHLLLLKETYATVSDPLVVSRQRASRIIFVRNFDDGEEIFP